MKRYRDTKLLTALATLPCVVCGSRWVELHHSRGTVGTGQRAGDHRAYPLCTHCHRTGPQSIHQIGRQAWEVLHGTEDSHIANCHQRIGFVLPEGDWQ